MKYLSTVILLLSFIVSSILAKTISDELESRINQSHSDDFLPVVIVMRQRVSPHELEQFKHLDKNQRRKRCIEYLKNKNSQYNAPAIEIIKAHQNEYVNLKELFITSVIVVDAKPDLIRTISELQEVEWVGLRTIRSALIDGVSYFNNFLETSWGLRQIQAPLVWNNYGIKGDGVLVGIVDTGVDYHHPALITRLSTNTGEIPWNGLDDDGNGYVDDVYGWDFTSDTPFAMDQKGHGTFVAGIAVGDSVGGNVIGTAPRARFIPIKVLDRNGSGEENWAWEGLEYALVMGVDVANLSIGWRNSEPHSRAVWRNIIDNAVASGMVVVVGAGNEGDETPAPNSIRTPGNVPSAITVGATNGSDAVADFSSVGPVSWADVPPYFDYPYPPGLLKPDLCAPGVNIFSSVLGGNFQSGWNGTSMSTPFVSGTVALMLQANPSLSPDSIKSILCSTTEDIWVRGPDTLSGYGRINALRAVQAAMNYSFGTLSCSIFPQAKTKITDGIRSIIIDESSGFTVDLMAPSDYIAIFSAYAFSPETISFHIEPGWTITRNISLRPLEQTRTLLEIRDFDSGELVSRGFIEYMGSVYECGEDTGSSIVLEFPAHDTVEVIAGASGYVSTRERFLVDGVRKAIFVHRAIDFESDSVFVPTAGRDWQWGRPTYATGPESCRSGERCWGTNLRGDYSNSTNSWLMTPTFTADETDSPYVAFWQWYDFEATSNGWWDGGNLWLSVDESPFGIIVPVSGYSGVIDSYNTILGGYPAFSGEVVGRAWHQVEFDLSRYAESSRFIFIFRVGSDNNTPRPGWYIDDFAFIPRSRKEPFIFHRALQETVRFPVLFSSRVVPVNTNLDPSSVKVHIFSETIDTILQMVPVFGYNDSFVVEFVPPPEYSGEMIRYFISARDIRGQEAREPQTAPDSTHSFRIIWDTEPPNIELLYMPTHSFANASGYRVCLRINDASTVDTSSIILWYRLNMAEFYSTREFTYSGTENNYCFVIPNREIRANSVDWYVECDDNSPRRNHSRYPSVGFLSFYPVDSIYWDFQSEPYGVSDGIWEWGEPTDLDGLIEPGDKVWATSIRGNYPDNNYSRLYLDEIDLYGISEASFKFRHLCLFEGTEPFPDGGDIWVRTSDGVETKIHPSGGYDGISADWNTIFAGDSVFGGVSNWRWVYGSISEFVGKRVSFIFRFASDSAGNSRGWFIDDFSLVSRATKIDTSTIKPNLLCIEGPFPNPSNSSVRFLFSNKIPKEVQINAYDILGRLVFDARMANPKGISTLTIDLKDFVSGIYFVRLVVDDTVYYRKVIVLK